MEYEKNQFEISKNIYWVGKQEHEGMLHCNPYLLVDGEEAILFDPGSPLEYKEVIKNVKSIISLDKLKYVVLHHEDPDICASVPLLEAAGAKFTLICHSWARTMIRYYGVESDYYVVNEEGFKLRLKSGRELDFIETPYLHSPGAIVTYDVSTKTLFSSDLFGAYSSNWELYAKEDYIEKMIPFHETFMASTEALKDSIEILETLEIMVIAPQHGSVVNKNIDYYLKALNELNCGAALMELKKSRPSHERYIKIVDELIKRYKAIFGETEIFSVLEKMNLKVDPVTERILSHEYVEKELLAAFFETVYREKGVEWLSEAEGLVKKLTEGNGFPMPEIFQQSLKRAELDTAECVGNIQDLRKQNSELTKMIKETEEKIMTDGTTKFYNVSYFNSFLLTEVESALKKEKNQSLGLIVIGIDNLAKIKYLYGDQEADEIMKSVAYILQGFTQNQIMRFRLQGATFAITISGLDKKGTVSLAEEIRNKVAEFEGFIEKTTVSMGLALLDEVVEHDTKAQMITNHFHELAMTRLGIAKNDGTNTVCSESGVEKTDIKIGKIVIADSDRASRNFLKDYLEFSGFHVFDADNGEAAYELINKVKPDVIISDIMLPKMDGFILREKLLEDSILKNSIFVFLSHLKDEDSLKRALSLDVDYYYKKPYMVVELVGIIKNRMRSVALN